LKRRIEERQGARISLMVNSTSVRQAALSTFVSDTVSLRGINDGEDVFEQLSIAQA
jgi:hypothetical protein